MPLAFLLLSPVLAVAEFPALLQQRLAQEGTLQAAGEPIIEHSLLRHLYRRNGYHPLWDNPVSRKALMHWIEHSAAEGLEPADYHRDALRRIAGTAPSLPQEQVERELLLTDAMLLLGIHLSTGKVDASRLFREWNYIFDARKVPDSGQVLAALSAGKLGELFAARVPAGRIYRQLRRALARYRSMREQGGWPRVPPGPTLHPGDRSPRVAVLRERLLAELGDETLGSAQPERFDPHLEEAVKTFQRLHLLETDGLVGPLTLAELNVPLERRIDQIRINLERVRWLYHGLPEDFYAVDLAGFVLYHGREWSSPIQVGRAYHQTPVFHDLIELVEINPTWTVPRSITIREILPRLLADPLGYLRRREMDLLTPEGRLVDPATVDWSALGPRNFPYVLRQRPGPHNALGRIKFLFPNKYAVYLHDTPARELFHRPRRAFSHGCIRVAKPLELGVRLLRPNGPEWTRQHLEELIEAGSTVRVKLRRPVPILIVYLTAMPDFRGTTEAIQFREDLYRRDPPVLEGLAAPPRERGAELMAEYRRQLGVEW